MDTRNTCTAFADGRRLASGARWEVALAVKAALAAQGTTDIQAFDDTTGRMVDFDLRGSDEEIAARLRPPPEPRGAGRPKLGVTAREVTLLPRHWEWLASQPGGASVTLRKLVEAARAGSGERDRARGAQAASDCFMRAMLGNQPGYEEAARALYAGDAARFGELTDPWPTDLRDHARQLAAPVFAQD